MSKCILFFILSVISASVHAENYKFSLNAGDLISDTYNYATGNSQGNPTIFDSNQTRRAKETKIKAEERAKTQAEKRATKMASQSIKKAELNALEKGLMKPITKQGLAQGAKIAGGAYLAKSGVGSIAKHTLTAGTIIGVGGAAIEIGEDIEYQKLINSPLYKELYNEISAKASIIDEQLYEKNKKYRSCSKAIAKSYLSMNPEDFENIINNNYLIGFQTYDKNNILFSVNTFIKNNKLYSSVYKKKKGFKKLYTADHIPSYAAIAKFLNISIDRGSNNNYEQNTSTIFVTPEWHQAGNTYWSKNNKKTISFDSKDLRDATLRDLSEIGTHILKNSDEYEKEKYIKNGMILYSRNALLCLYSK